MPVGQNRPVTALLLRKLFPVLITVTVLSAACGQTHPEQATDPLPTTRAEPTATTTTTTTKPPTTKPPTTRAPTPADSDRGEIRFRGVNLAGAEFGFNRLPGEFGVDYTYPGSEDVSFFVNLGMDTVRLPFLWERLQPRLGEEFDSSEQARLEAFVTSAREQGMAVILDPHNYARYHGSPIGSAEVPTAAFTNLWSRLAHLFGGDPGVVFGLMNEPYDMAAETWLKQANSAVAAIRSVGAPNLILVPGTQYTGADSWLADWYGTPNGEVMDGVVDPLDNYAIEVHQYLDDDSSGTSPVCVSTAIGTQRLEQFTSWLRRRGEVAFLGEFGGGDNNVCLEAIDGMLSYLEDNGDVWIGWTYWAAGPWWGEDPFEIQPGPEGQIDPQLEILERHLPAPRDLSP